MLQILVTDFVAANPRFRLIICPLVVEIEMVDVNRRPRLKFLVRKIRTAESKLLASVAEYEELRNQVANQADTRLMDDGFADAALKAYFGTECLAAFRRRLHTARRHFADDSAIAGRNWVIQRHLGDLQLTEAHAKIDSLRNEVGFLTDEILACPVTTLPEICEKLAFASSVLMFSENCDQDRFVYVVEECTEVLRTMCSDSFGRRVT